MKKIKNLSFILAAAIGLVSCVNPIGFSPELKLKIEGSVEITGGQLDTKDITAASTYIVNMSKSLDFTGVRITQNGNPRLATETEPYLISSFNNSKDSRGAWKIIKTKYVQASDIEYEVELNIQNKPGGAFSFKKGTDMYATQSKGIYYVWMYRTSEQAYIDEQISAGVPAELADVVVVSPNDPNTKRPFPVPDQNDTTNVEVNIGGSNNADIVDVLQKIANVLINGNGGTGDKSPEDENGSVPSIISPNNRTQMATFIVVNLSRTRNVDWVNFVDTARTYTSSGGQTENLAHTINSVSITDKGQLVQFPAVAALDRRGIALMQGEYKIMAGHNGRETTPWKTGIVVPSNDPQSEKEHYAYFYKDKSGNYTISTEYPRDSDLDPTDLLPPAQGYGVGRITLVNKTTGAVLESLTLESRDNRSRGNLALGYTSFTKGAPVGVNQYDSVDIIGTSQFPIDGYFIASVQALTNEGIATVTRIIYLNNTIAEIIVTDNDVSIQKVPGARITVFNSVNASNVSLTVNSVKIKDGAGNYQVFSTFLSNGQSYQFDVLNSAGMPVIDGQDYYADADVAITKIFTGGLWQDADGNLVNEIQATFSGTITNVPISPNGKLYHKDGPASNQKTIMINDAVAAPVIPSSPPPAPPFTAVSDVIILNGTYEGDGVKFFAKDGTARRLDWTVTPDTANNRNGYWTLGSNDPNAATGTYSLSQDGILIVTQNWQYEYLYVAFVVENGTAPGSRNPVHQAVGNLIGSLNVDLAKDFVKVIKLKTPPPPPPPPPYQPRWAQITFTNNDSGYNPGMRYLILYRINDGVNIGSNDNVKKGYPYGLSYYLYTYGKYENTDLGKVWPRRPTSGDDVQKFVARPLPGGNEAPGMNMNEALYNHTLPAGVTQATETIGNHTIPVTKVSNDATTVAGASGFSMSSPNALKVLDSVVIEFDKILDGPKHNYPNNPRSYTFWLDGNYNWLVCWIGSNDKGAVNSNPSKYWTRAGWDGNIWFVLPPMLRSGYTDTTISTPIEMKGQVWAMRY